MLKFCLLSLSSAAVALALSLPCDAAPPVKIKEVAPVADLVTEADAKIKLIEGHLENETTFDEVKKDRKLATDAYVLAILAQGVAEHDDASAWKATAADVREAARQVGSAKTYDDAKKAFATLKEAHAGKGSGAKVEADWAKVGRLGRTMVEVSKRQTKLRRATKKLPEDTSEAARDASVLAVLALTIHADTHEVKNPADKPEWYKLSDEFRGIAMDLNKSLVAKDAEGSKAAFNKLGKSCQTCHDKFKTH